MTAPMPPVYAATIADDPSQDVVVATDDEVLASDESLMADEALSDN